MSEIYFTSDTHFGHKNILSYCPGRAKLWQNLEDMNEELLERINSVVYEGDHLYHLGDFCFSRNPDYFRRKIRCKNLYLIKGNHDSRTALNGLFAWIKDTYELRADGYKFWLSHYAHRRWPSSHHGAFHLYGHSHGDLPGYGRSMDVGVDAVDYRPISLEEIVRQLSKLPVTAHHANDGRPDAIL
jgi:calcineurin-like phosphoesterase family protein